MAVELFNGVQSNFSSIAACKSHGVQQYVFHVIHMLKFFNTANLTLQIQSQIFLLYYFQIPVHCEQPNLDEYILTNAKNPCL